MKTLILILISFSALAARPDPKDISFTTINGHETVKLMAPHGTDLNEAFEFLDSLVPWYSNRIVTIDGVNYFRYGLFIRHKTFILIEKKNHYVIRRLRK